MQHRMAYQGEYFVERYGAEAAEATPPVARMLDSGRAGVGRHGCDACRLLQSVGLAVVAGHRPDRRRAALYPQRNCLDRETALRMWTENVTLVLQRGGQEGADRAGPVCRPGGARPATIFSCPEATSRDITSMLTMVGGKVV